MNEKSVSWLPNLVDARAYFDNFDWDRSLLAFDTETTGLKVRNGADTPRIVQFSWRPWTHAVVVPVTSDFDSFIDWVFTATEEIVGHNTKFDMHAMMTGGFDLTEYYAPNEMHDTLWLARFNDERHSAKLKDLGTRYLRSSAAGEQQALKRKMRANGWNWNSVPLEYLVQYGGEDAIMTGELFDFFMPRISWGSEAYLREQQLSPILFRMERTGLHIDAALLKATTEEYSLKVEDSSARLDELSPGLNPRSPKQVKEAFEARGIVLENTQKATLQQVDDVLAKTLIEYREAHKTLGTYLKPWEKLIEPTGRLHPWFSQLGTSTGRFSSSDPNLQNIPRGHVLRDIFTAAPGHKMLVADWNQMELRLYAHFANDQNMLAAFLSEDDLYQQVADLLGVPRQIGKMIMLASIYGAGPRTLKNQCVVMFGNESPELLEQLLKYDWEELYDKFHAQYRIKELSRQCENAARKRSMFDEAYIRTWGGRRQRPKLVLRKQEVNGRRPEITIYKDLANSLVQGSSADLMKQALIDVDAAGYGKYLRLTVHDEMVLEVPDEEVEEVQRAIEKIMTRNEFMPPLTVSSDYAPSYGEAK